MENNEKNILTGADKKQDNILLKLKALAMRLEYGTMQMEVKINDGRIVEMRYKDFVGVIRSS